MKWTLVATRIVFLFAMAAATVQPTSVSAQAAIREWKQYADPAEAGFSVTELNEARRYADSVRSAAVMVVHRGLVVAAWGDINRKLGLHSVRKSLVSALYGIAVTEGKIDLDTNLAQLGIDERESLTPVEKQAKIRDLISARSGVYLPAAYAGSEQDTDRPARSAYAPGTHWFYNNWDFNVAGVIYQKRTREKLYESFMRRIAKPIGMQDFQVSDGLEVIEPSRSIHPAHTFRMSTRDLARFGQLYLQQGNWNGRQIVPASWVKESTSSKSEIAPKQGYGYMWWTYAADSASARYPRASQHSLFQARGTGGQVLFIIPDEEMVIVLRGDTDNNRNVGGGASWTIVERILSAKKSDPIASARLIALAPVPFRSQAPELPEQRFVALDRSHLEKYVGNYTMGPNAVARVFMHEGRLFMFFPGRGEAELFALSPNEFTIRVLGGVKVTFEADAQGTATAVLAQFGPETMRGTKSQ